jgi:hypothetical protein
VIGVRHPVGDVDQTGLDLVHRRLDAVVGGRELVDEPDVLPVDLRLHVLGLAVVGADEPGDADLDLPLDGLDVGRDLVQVLDDPVEVPGGGIDVLLGEVGVQPGEQVAGRCGVGDEPVAQRLELRTEPRGGTGAGRGRAAEQASEHGDVLRSRVKGGRTDADGFLKRPNPRRRGWCG